MGIGPYGETCTTLISIWLRKFVLLASPKITYLKMLLSGNYSYYYITAYIFCKQGQRPDVGIGPYISDAGCKEILELL